MTRSRIGFGAILFLATIVAYSNVHGGNPRGGWQSEVQRLEDLAAELAAANAAITVEVDPAACIMEPEQCSAFSPLPAASNNRNPVRLVIQIVASKPVDDLLLESFDLRTQFSPSDEGRIEPLICPACFEHREGGTYSIWVVPAEGDWEEGFYYLLVATNVDDKVLRALVRIEIPLGIDVQNEPPRAVVSIVPPTGGQAEQLITFDGSGSFDPDGLITCFQWQILSDNPDNPAGPNPVIVQGVAAAGFQRVFVNEQTLSVTLLVSDRPDIDCADVDENTPGNPVEPSEVFSPFVSRSQYSIACRNDPPTAVIAGSGVIQATGSPSTLTSITLDGRLSFDNETRLDRYVWSCGNEFAPIQVTPGNPTVVVCRYRPGTYTATLTVIDQGTGVVDPTTGTFECQKTSELDTVTVNIVLP